jgi:hypothetical protein
MTPQKLKIAEPLPVFRTPVSWDKNGSQTKLLHLHNDAVLSASSGSVMRGVMKGVMQ